MAKNKNSTVAPRTSSKKNEPSWASQQYRDAKQELKKSISEHRTTVQKQEDAARFVAQADADRIRAITGTAPVQYPKDIEAMRRKNPGESFQYFDNKTKSWVKVPALDPSKSVRAQAKRLQFDDNGQPVDAFTRNYIKQAEFGPNGQAYGARANQLLKAGYKPVISAVSPNPVTATPVAPTPVVGTPAPGAEPVDATPVDPTTVVTPMAEPVAATPYPTYGKVAATVREPNFNAAKAGSYQKPGVVGIVAPNAGGSFASAQPKTSNKQSLNGLGAQADFGRSFGDSYAKNGNRKDGLF